MGVNHNFKTSRKVSLTTDVSHEFLIARCEYADLSVLQLLHILEVHPVPYPFHQVLTHTANEEKTKPAQNRRSYVLKLLEDETMRDKT